MTSVNAIILNPKSFLYWHIRRNDPVKYSIDSSRTWFLVNPLVYLGFDKGFRREHHLSLSRTTAITSERVIALASGIMFVDRDGNSIQKDADGEAFDKVISQVCRFLAKLRYVSKQFEIPTRPEDFFVISFSELRNLPAPYFPDVDVDPNVRLRRTIADSAITKEHFEKSAQYSTDYSPPVFDTILLDAIQAYSDGDYRRTILNSAIAIETIASTKLDEAYRSILEQNNPETNLRIISIQQAGGKTIIKDPIYEHLSSRTDFGQLLHERPLYLLNKSLLVENERLYQIARKLYSTRNKISHLGTPPSGDNLPFFSICEADAQLALECVTEVFKWFGESGQYIIPDGKFSSVSEIASGRRSG